ncbi:MAG TPA: 16S rRNA (cytidine(1402)-2'-O)-methyltransferase [Candidatus Kapabacteria bacterium]|nr:16S rRNA (cytidine(1402)-2'-O)-methyltransferase [Candidatus Kapabacteria bacterium]
MSPSGALYIVSVGIGDARDITLRAIETLGKCDIIVCEEAKPARALMKYHHIEKPIILLNEHTRNTVEDEILDELAAGKNIALISDCGTPLIADPGDVLIKKCIEKNITITPIPGASSILAALVVSGFRLDQFSFIGFLPREKSARARAASELKNRTETLVLLEAPYRLAQILDDLRLGIGSERKIAVCLDLTLAGERIYRGTVKSSVKYFEEHPFKGEFVIVLGPTQRPHRDRFVPRSPHKKHK